MNQLIIENVRCFYERQSVPLRPVTILVGENSAGKSTFLSLTRMAWDISDGLTTDFNKPPFYMGAYDQIAAHLREQSGQAESFTIGAGVLTGDHLKKSCPGLSDILSVTGRFIRESAHPHLREWTFDAGSHQMKVIYDRSDKPSPSRITVTVPSGTAEISDRSVLSESLSHLSILGCMNFVIPGIIRRREGTVKIPHTPPSDADMKFLSELMDHYSNSLGLRPRAFAPIRTRPKRTYDPLKYLSTPEGTHIPMLLARMRTSHPRAWEKLRESLSTFGKASGLFSEVDVRRMGKEESDPFQITVKDSGPAFNLMDVGYGVSQILPILVDLLVEIDETCLLQQPEVHLHPMAQAELGSFLAIMAKQQDMRFLIETHSDYLVDRIRMDVRDRDYLSKEDVSLLFFERSDGRVKIHPLELDDMGNIINAPFGYRQFFLEESTRIVGKKGFRFSG